MSQSNHESESQSGSHSLTSPSRPRLAAPASPLPFPTHSPLPASPKRKTSNSLPSSPYDNQTESQTLVKSREWLELYQKLQQLEQEKQQLQEDYQFHLDKTENQFSQYVENLHAKLRETDTCISSLLTQLQEGQTRQTGKPGYCYCLSGLMGIGLGLGLSWVMFRRK